MYPEFRITTHFGLQPLAVLFFFSAVSLWCLKFYLNQSIWSAKQKIQDPPSCFSHAHPCTHPSGRKHASASILSFILFCFLFLCVYVFFALFCGLLIATVTNRKLPIRFFNCLFYYFLHLDCECESGRQTASRIFVNQICNLFLFVLRFFNS